MKIFVLSSRIDQINKKDLTNGAVSRLIAWKIFFPEIEFLDFSERSAEKINNYDKSFRIILDLCGEKTIKIFTYWLSYRKFMPVCFLQDSQSRYYYTKCKFEKSLINKIISLVNFARGIVKECLAKVLYESVGYISSADRIVNNKAKYIELLYSMVGASAKNIKACFSIKKIRLIGNFYYDPNVQGVMQILHTKKFIEVCEKNSISLIFSGKGAMDFIITQCDRIKNIIDVDASGEFNCIDELRCDDQIFLCPVFYGAGIKNKIIEASVLGEFTLAWEGVRGDFMYKNDLVGYYSDPEDLADCIDFMHNYLMSAVDYNFGFFDLILRYQMERFIKNTGFIVHNGR